MTNTWQMWILMYVKFKMIMTEIFWTAAYQAPLSMGFSRQKYWSGVPLPSSLSLVTLNYPSGLRCKENHNC